MKMKGQGPYNPDEDEKVFIYKDLIKSRNEAEKRLDCIATIICSKCKITHTEFAFTMPLPEYVYNGRRAFHGHSTDLCLYYAHVGKNGENDRWVISYPNAYCLDCK